MASESKSAVVKVKPSSLHPSSKPKIESSTIKKKIEGSSKQSISSVTKTEVFPCHDSIDFVIIFILVSFMLWLWFHWIEFGEEIMFWLMGILNSASGLNCDVVDSLILWFILMFLFLVLCCFNCWNLSLFCFHCVVLDLIRP